MNSLSFGIKTAPSECNRIIDQILQGLPKTISYFDDIIVHGESMQECINKNSFLYAHPHLQRLGHTFISSIILELKSIALAFNKWC